MQLAREIIPQHANYKMLPNVRRGEQKRMQKEKFTMADKNAGIGVQCKPTMVLETEIAKKWVNGQDREKATETVCDNNALARDSLVKDENNQPSSPSTPYQYYANERLGVLTYIDVHDNKGINIITKPKDPLTQTEINGKPKIFPCHCKDCKYVDICKAKQRLEIHRSNKAAAKVQPHHHKQQPKQLHNKFPNSIISIHPPGWATAGKYSHLMPPRQCQSPSCAHLSKHFPKLYDLINLICMLLLTMWLCHYTLQLPMPVAAGCRDEPSRSCEAICRPKWLQADNAKHFEDALHLPTHPSPAHTPPALRHRLDAAYANSFQDYDCRIRALVLLPDNDTYLTSLRRVVPILKVAEQYIHQSGLLPSFVSFNWMPHDDKCDAAFAMVNVMDGIVKNCAHAIFGPTCDYGLAGVGRITKYFNGNGTPLITVGGATFDFESKKTSCADEFYMLLRTGVLSFRAISDLTISVMKSYKWSRSIFFYDRDGQRCVAGQHTCFLMMKTLGEQMRKENMIFSQHWISRDHKRRHAEMIREIGNKHSVIIMCADPQSIRKIMLTAEELNMIDSGEYVFINIELFSRVPYLTSQPWYDKNDTAENNERARKAYTAMLTVTPKQPDDEEYTKVSNEIKAIAEAKYNYTFHDNEPISVFVTSFFDGVLLYANALNDSIREDPSVLTRPINGTDMVRRMWNRSFMGITGNVTIDGNGDRISAYSLLDMNPTTGRFEIVAHFQHNKLEYVPGKTIHWSGNRLEPPLDRPVCGYDGSLCPDNSLPGYAILSLVLGVVVVIMSVCFFFGYRHYKSEAEINSMAWRVSKDDVIFHNSAGRCFRGSLHSLVKHNSQMTLMSDDMGSLSGDRQIFIPVGLFRGCKVAIKTVDERNSITLTRSLMLELKRMKDLQHDHLVKFFGACLEPSKSFILTEYCPKGSLQDILENEQFQLDWMFKLSLMHDIVRGMQFLHNSDIKSHGNLKSSNCVVDSRFVLKICDFGLHTLRRATADKDNDVENCNSHSYWSKLLWTAPELLKMENNRPPEGTQKGDVYSFAIIVHEISTRQGPFYLGKLDEKSPQDIIYLVKGYPHLLQTPFRPQLAEIPRDYKEINGVMQKCWSEDPTERPDFNSLKSIIRNINKDNETGHIVDNLLKRMEQYANNLEELVEERTQDYIEEKKKCEKLLYQLLPQSVAAQLISGEPVVAETFDQVTIYFSDIVGFTAISAESTPMQVVQFLNDLYTCFDSIVENFDVYKVETIGDAYMVVSGLPIRNDNQHSREIARLALALLEAVHNFKIHHRPNDRLKLRIGLHTGACVAGVVGLKMPRYCLFGDTVNTASRMESNGEALKIHISEKTKIALDAFGTFITTKRGFVPMKGKGEMLTYWLEGEIPKVETPISPQKLMLSRRSSLKQVARMGLLHKQNSEALPFPANYQLQQQLDLERSVSRQNSPNLRVKRKISSSSPKLNGSDFKTDDFYNYLGMNAKNSMKLSPPHSDIYSSRSLKDDPKEGCWELANFRLPLSGALKTHNNSKHSYTQLSSTQSNSNLTGLLQPAASRLRMKNSPTISSLMNNSETASLGSSTRIKFNVSETPEETQNLVSSNVYEDDEGEAEAEAVASRVSKREAPKAERKSVVIMSPFSNGEHFQRTQTPPATLMNHNELTATANHDQPHQQNHQLTNAGPLYPPLNAINTSLSNSKPAMGGGHTNNLVQANNCKNINQYFANNSSNTPRGADIEDDEVALTSPTFPISDEGGGSVANVGSCGNATTVTAPVHNRHINRKHHQSAPSSNAVTQPLLAKINS
ncbi:atrial natriuretic peptide receptor 1 isoform X1 [Stomoxys calcitrans]|uniref:atrial natriuretic peptide receptor 1 isoform X1 n=1 Tax=Stomoxys calcitrans TaxID=35570 RepID=UPI0027E2A723|nr:atrial natriuretic peptide receptor 1 isoform X1 [Stomoxys calcitrans]